MLSVLKSIEKSCDISCSSFQLTLHSLGKISIRGSSELLEVHVPISCNCAKTIFDTDNANIQQPKILKFTPIVDIRRIFTSNFPWFLTLHNWFARLPIG